MKLNLLLFAAALAALSTTIAAPAQAREAYFDHTNCCLNDDETTVLDIQGTVVNPLYEVRYTSPTGNRIEATNGVPAPGVSSASSELSFDVTYTADDTSNDFLLIAHTNRPGGGAATASAAGPVTVTSNKFSTAISLADPLGVAPPVVLSFSGQLAPGLFFDGFGGMLPLQRSTNSNGFSLLFNLATIVPEGHSNGDPVFSSFDIRANIVPEPATLLLATLGGFATWQMTRRRSRRL